MPSKQSVEDIEKVAITHITYYSLCTYRVQHTYRISLKYLHLEIYRHLVKVVKG